MTLHQPQEQFSRSHTCPRCEELRASGITAGIDGAEWPGGRANLSPNEATVFAYLLRRRVATTENLALELYGLDPNGGPTNAKNCVDVYVCKLRRRLRDAGFPGHIETIWGRGYRLVLTETIEKGR